MSEYHCQTCWGIFKEDPGHCPKCKERYGHEASRLDLILGRTPLQACRRDGTEDEWWGERHKYCTGSQHLTGVGTVVLCDCDCHHEIRVSWPISGVYGVEWRVSDLVLSVYPRHDTF